MAEEGNLGGAGPASTLTRRTHFRSSELTQQVRIDLRSVGQTSRSPTCLQATIPLFDRRNHSSVPTWVLQDVASAGGQ